MNIKKKENSNQLGAPTSVPQQLTVKQKANIQEAFGTINQQQIEDVFNIKSKQFTFDSGLKMGNLRAPLTNMLFSLKYHDTITTDFESFLASVTAFIKTAGPGMEPTSSDIAKLKAHYEKYSVNGRK